MRQRRESRWAAKQFLLEEARETGRQEASEDEGNCDVDSDGGNDFDGDEGSDELGHGKNQSTSGRKRYPDNCYPKKCVVPGCTTDQALVKLSQHRAHQQISATERKAITKTQGPDHPGDLCAAATS